MLLSLDHCPQSLILHFISECLRSYLTDIHRIYVTGTSGCIFQLCRLSLARGRLWESACWVVFLVHIKLLGNCTNTILAIVCFLAYNPYKIPMLKERDDGSSFVNRMGCMREVMAVQGPNGREHNHAK